MIFLFYFTILVKKKQGNIVHKIGNIIHLFFCKKIIDNRCFVCYDKSMENRYYKHKIENLLTINKIVVIHHLRLDESYSSEREAHDFWELIYADKGDVICEAGGQERTLKEGEILFHKPGEIHSFRTEGENATSTIFVCFECKSEAIHFFEDKCIAVSKSLLRFLYGVIDEGQNTFELANASPMITKMKLRNAPILGGQQMVKNNLELFLIHLMRRELGNTADAVFLSPEEYDERVAKLIIDYLKAHVKERITVSDVCAALHYNKSYLFKQFKKATDCGVMAYFTHLKLAEAKKMLKNSSLSVAEIATVLAFDSSNYFSKAFKKETGMTPSDYRKKKKSSL